MRTAAEEVGRTAEEAGRIDPEAVRTAEQVLHVEVARIVLVVEEAGRKLQEPE